MTRCLVTGGAGFIGSHLVEALVANQHEVRVLDNFSTGAEANLAAVHEAVEIVAGDVLDLDVVREACRDVDFVFHLAALTAVPFGPTDAHAIHQVCATGTLHLLTAAREAGVRRLIYAGCSNAYGNSPQLPKREADPVQPLTPDAVAKLTGEHYCAAFSYLHGLETVRLRYFNVFGPRQQPAGPFAGVIPLFLEAMLGGRGPVILGDGLQTRDFTYVDNIVQANLLAMEAPRVTGKVYNIACGRRTTLLELAGLINSILGARLKPLHGKMRPGDIRHSQADITRSQADLGYCPVTDLEQGLRRCLDHVIARRGPYRNGVVRERVG